jgi:hypothetical protein
VADLLAVKHQSCQNRLRKALELSLHSSKLIYIAKIIYVVLSLNGYVF